MKNWDDEEFGPELAMATTPRELNYRNMCGSYAEVWEVLVQTNLKG